MINKNCINFSHVFSTRGDVLYKITVVKSLILPGMNKIFLYLCGDENYFLFEFKRIPEKFNFYADYML